MQNKVKITKIRSGKAQTVDRPAAWLLQEINKIPHSGSPLSRGEREMDIAIANRISARALMRLKE